MARPREFDEDEVLDASLRLFWLRGYEGTSLTDLLSATGLTKSSLYKTFTSKAALYRRAKDRYNDDFLRFQRDALVEPTPRRIAQRLLYETADFHTSADTPPGCFETNGALACSTESDDIRRELIKSREQKAIRLKKRFDEVRHAGPLIGKNSEEAARFVITLIQGMAVSAKSGATREQLRRFISLALMAWPET